jgi:hypothetical protein
VNWDLSTNSTSTRLPERSVWHHQRWPLESSRQSDGRDSLAFLGEDTAAYQRVTIKSQDDPESWADLIHLCKVLNERRRINW